MPQPAPIPLLFLITDLNLGGSPLMLRTLARGIRDLGNFAPAVVSIAPPGPVSELIAADQIPVHSLNAARPTQLLSALSAWTKLVNQTRPALIHSILLHANALATLAKPFCHKCVYIQSIHTLQAYPRWHRSAERFLRRFATGVVVPSGAILSRMGIQPLTNRYEVIQNGINLSLFSNAQPISPTLLPWPPNARVLAYIGRFDPVKRLPELLEGFAMAIHNNSNLNDLHLALIGYGPLEPALRAQANGLKLSDRIHFPGSTLTPERWYKSISALCLPSDAEGFGLTLVESLAAGTPVLAVDTPPTRSILGNAPSPTLGELAATPTPSALSLAIQKLMTSPHLHDPAAIALRSAQAAPFSQEVMCSAYNNFYKNILTP